jgi:hypothetical protein
MYYWKYVLMPMFNPYTYSFEQRTDEIPTQPAADIHSELSVPVRDIV